MPAQRDADTATLTSYWEGFADSPDSPVGYVLRHRTATLRAVRAVRRLPTLDADPSSATAGGRAIRDALTRTGPLGTPARWQGAAVRTLPVSTDPDDHLAGPQNATLRRKVRKARRAGVTCAPVPVADRPGLVDRAEAAEQEHPQDDYATDTPDNADLLDHDLWLAAYDTDGEPLVLAVIPTDGRWSLLRYFRTLGWERVHSDARYLLTHELGVALARRGVRHLLDSEPPGRQTNGIRHFQKMVGYRYVRVRLSR